MSMVLCLYSVLFCNDINTTWIPRINKGTLHCAVISACIQDNWLLCASIELVLFKETLTWRTFGRRIPEFHSISPQIFSYCCYSSTRFCRKWHSSPSRFIRRSRDIRMTRAWLFTSTQEANLRACCWTRTKSIKSWWPGTLNARWSMRPTDSDSATIFKRLNVNWSLCKAKILHEFVFSFNFLIEECAKSYLEVKVSSYLLYFHRRLEKQ